ncbi:MAG: ATP-binding protein [Flavobacteriales bacterium]|nr:ATP-binding protein [Flavobacteriales bacterium]
MQGLLSSNRDKNRGIRFYRLMSVIGIVISAFFALVFLVFLDNSKELVWDRVVVGVISALVYGYSFMNIPTKRFFRASSFLFYVFTAQVVISCALNDYEIIHLLALFLTLQAIAISFKTQKATVQYLVTTNLLLFICIIIMPSSERFLGVYVSLSFMIGSGLIFFIVRTKVKFQSSTKLQKELLLALINKTEDSIVVTDFEGVIYEATPQAGKLFDYDYQELEGLDISDFRKHRLTEEEDRIGVSKLLKEKFWNDEIRMKKRDGSEFDAFVSISWIHMFNLEYLVYRIRDISEDNAAKAELIKAKEDAEAAAKAKAEFLATMSHEIRTPMNGVIGMTELLGDTPLNEEQKNFVNTIQISGKNLLTIINDILDFSKAESGKIELEEAPFDLEQTMDEIMDLVAPSANKKNIELKKTINKGVPKSVVGDSTRLKQIVLNLIGNAVKFTHEGSVELAVRKRSSQEGMLNLEFAIIDTGIGIPSEKMDFLFESFSKVDSSTTRKYGGTGLGLAISKKLIELMGGKVMVSSEDGKGSKFTFNVHLDSVQQEIVPENIEVSETEEESLLSTLNVLVAEDNLINQQVIKLLLQKKGVNVTIANNGLEVLNLVNSDLFDLILMDIQMPEMDGLEATERLLTDDQYGSRVPDIIAMTANAMDQDRRNCEQAGMKGFISKPINVEELKTVLLKAARHKN